MKKITNTNWNCESKLVNIEEVESDSFNEDSQWVSFEYNGHKLKAEVDFTLWIDVYVEEDTDYKRITVTDTELTLKEIWTEDFEKFECTLSEDMDIQNQLLIDLKVQF